MKKAFVVIVDVLLVFFLLAVAGNIVLELSVMKPGDGLFKCMKGLELGVTTIPFSGKEFSCPEGSIALVKRIAASEARPGDVLLCFDESGERLLACEVDSIKGNYLLVNNGSAMVEIGDDRVVAKYTYAMVGAYDTLLWLRTPVVVGSISGALVLLFILARVVGGRKQNRPLSQSDGEIASMFRH